MNEVAARSRAGSATWRLGYRPALDGLRGIAILLVLLQHAGVPGFAQTGYLGVTLFFVLSGFLITTLLVDERQRIGTTSLLGFYRRRALRLFPALLVFTLVVSAWLLLTSRVAQVGGGAGPTLLYFADITRAASADMGLFDHTWSLAIEEQFYLLWPLAFALALWRSRWLAIGILIVLAAGSMLWRLALMDGSLFRVAFAPDTRADAILIGCVLGLWVTSRSGPPRMLGGVAWAAFGVALIISMGTTWTGTLTALPLFAIASFALVVHAISGSPPVLAWAPLVRLGTISYGLYLWHLPILREGGRLLELGPIQPLLLIGLSLAVAAVSYRWIEQPFLHLRHPPAAARIPTQVV